MSCATAPAFWARQQRLPLPLQRFVRTRLEAALEDPEARSLLVWPTILGAPRVREAHPEGIPEEALLSQAGRMLAALGVIDPKEAWTLALKGFPDTADKGATGWLPQRIWDPLSAQLSLRCGVILLALTGQPENERYRLASGVTLFNSALFHECHDALESHWIQASGDLKKGLQGLILTAAGFYHQQNHDALGMTSLWKDALAALEPFEGELTTPWGTVDFSESLAAMEQRIAWLRGLDTDAVSGLRQDTAWGSKGGHRDRREQAVPPFQTVTELDGLWDLPRPEWKLQ